MLLFSQVHQKDAWDQESETCILQRRTVSPREESEHGSREQGKEGENLSLYMAMQCRRCAAAGIPLISFPADRVMECLLPIVRLCKFTFVD